jgi:hypothetical protein
MQELLKVEGSLVFTASIANVERAIVAKMQKVAQQQLVLDFLANTE